MKILSIETSCDETAAAVTEGRRVLSSSVYSQILLHKKWGGVVPSIARKAHEERIDFVISDALSKADKYKGLIPNFLTHKGALPRLRPDNIGASRGSQFVKNWYLRY